MQNVSRRNFLQMAGVAGVSALGLAACGGSGNGGGSDLITVGIINNDPSESGYRTANVEDFNKKFTKENGFDATSAYSLKNEEQINAAQQFIQDGVKYLLLSAADTSGWDSTLQAAKEAGTQVILFDRVVDASEDLYVAAVVSDMEAEGEMAAEWLAKQNLKEYNIVHIQGTIGSAAQVGRSAALNEKVKSEKNWNMVTQQTADWSAETAQQITQTVIDSGKPFNVVYCENDDEAKGAVAALDAANIKHGKGQDVIVMAYDHNKWALREVQKGAWNYDGQCNPYQADKIIEIIQGLEAGNAPAEKTIYMEETYADCDTITDEYIEEKGIGDDAK